MPKPENLHAQRLLGRAVRAVRADQGMTQEELANRTNLHATFISDIERGARNPSWITITRLAAGLGVRIAVIAEAYEDLVQQHQHDPS